jgi:hypothetical protein
MRAAPPFQAFTKHAKDCSRTRANEFWKSQFCGSTTQKFPALPSMTYKPRCDQCLRLDITGIASDGDYTVGTRIRLVWAIPIPTITNSADASFGATVFGRQASVPGIESIVAPIFTTVPIRVQIDRSKSVKDLLQQVQLQAVIMIPFQQTGIQQIRRISEYCSLGCQFQSHMVIQPRQPEDEYNAKDILFESTCLRIETDDIDRFRHHAICLEFILKPTSIPLRAGYDSYVVTTTKLRRLVARFEKILRQLSSLMPKIGYLHNSISVA